MPGATSVISSEACSCSCLGGRVGVGIRSAYLTIWSSRPVGVVVIGSAREAEPGPLDVARLEAQTGVEVLRPVVGIGADDDVGGAAGPGVGDGVGDEGDGH